MDLFEAIRTRRSVRLYQPTSVPESVIQQALDAALLAPNTSNIQPWEFYWVKNQEKKEALVKACLNQLAARHAAELIVVVTRVDTWKRNSEMISQILDRTANVPMTAKNYYKKLLPLVYTVGPLNIFGILKYFVQKIGSYFTVIPDVLCSRSDLFKVFAKTTALACENFMLAIVAQGYGCCPMEGYDSRRIKKILKLNRFSEVVMVIAVGKTDSKGIYGTQIRLNRELFIHVVD